MKLFCVLKMESVRIDTFLIKTTALMKSHDELIRNEDVYVNAPLEFYLKTKQRIKGINIEKEFKDDNIYMCAIL